MLESLVIEGYRCFERFEIPELRRVNLFVGRNNAGKSTVLEAAGLLLGGGDPVTLALVSQDRREPQSPLDNLRAGLADLFRGRSMEKGRSFSISGQRGGRTEFVAYEIGALRDLPHYPQPAASSMMRAEFSVHLRRSAGSRREFVAPVGQGFGLFALMTPDDVEALVEPARVTSLAHLGVARESLDNLVQSWNVVVGNPEERVVVDALKLLEPDLERIVITGGEQRVTVYGVLKGISGRVPFSSFGEGTWRVLGLSLQLARVRVGEALLIDEIDTGLHHTTMVKVWKLILTVARQRDLQVFATSHSQDCLRAMAELHAQEPELTRDFMLHYVSKDEPRARSFTAAEVQTAIEHDLELRG